MRFRPSVPDASRAARPERSINAAEPMVPPESTNRRARNVSRRPPPRESRPMASSAVMRPSRSTTRVASTRATTARLAGSAFASAVCVTSFLAPMRHGKPSQVTQLMHLGSRAPAWLIAIGM